MAILQIVEVPDKRLRMKSAPIKEINERIKKLAADMAETMYAAPGIGLAAIQIGEPLRMLVVDVTAQDEESELLTIINPEILSSEGEVVYEEGCLSLPGAFEEVVRPARIQLEYTDLEGERKHLEAEGLKAICIQHEIDHLNGVLFVDHVSSLKRKLAIKRVERFKKERSQKMADALQEAE